MKQAGVLNQIRVEESHTFPVDGKHPAAHGTAHRFLNWFSGVSAAISLSPFILSALDVGKVKEVRQVVDYNGACCSIIANKKPFGNGNYSFSNIAAGSVFQGLDGEHKGIQGNTYGIAGLISHLLLKTPRVGYHLGTGTMPDALSKQLKKLPRMGDFASEMKLSNALAAGGIILLGELSGSALEKWEQRQAAKKAEAAGEDVDDALHGSGKIGRAVSLGTKGMGMFIALPTMLAGVGHAIQVTTATFGVDKVSDISKPEGIGGHIMAFLGKPMGECGGQFKAPTGVATAGLVGLCCAVPAALGAVSVLASKHRENKQNHTGMKCMTDNNATDPSTLSLMKSDVGDLIKYHHDMPWDRFEREAKEVTARMEQMEKEVARREKLGSMAKWGLRATAIAGSVAGALLWQKNGRKADVAPTIDTTEAQNSLSAFDKADKAPFAPKFLLNRAPGSDTPPLLGEPGTEEAAAAYRAQMKDLPPKTVFRRIDEDRVTAMGEKGDALPGCCISDKSGCCGTPYYKGDVTKGLYTALSGLMAKLPETAVAATTKSKRGVAFAGGITVGVGVFFEMADKVEQRIVAKPKSQLADLRARNTAIQGIIGHMERDKPDFVSKSRSGQAEGAAAGHGGGHGR